MYKRSADQPDVVSNPEMPKIYMKVTLRKSKVYSQKKPTYGLVDAGSTLAAPHPAEPGRQALTDVSYLVRRERPVIGHCKGDVPALTEHSFLNDPRSVTPT